MKRKQIPHTRGLRVNNSWEGQDLMTKLRIRTEQNTKESEMPSRPLLYSERKDGVLLEGNPRTDKWDIMQDATDFIARTKIDRRNHYDKSKMEKANAEKNPAGASGQGPDAQS